MTQARPSHVSGTVEQASTAGGVAQLWTLVVLSALMGFGSISTDLYLPALPIMAKALRTTGGTVEFTIGAYLIGFSLGQLLWGPIGDRYGRRYPMAIGLALFALASIGCALATDSGHMIAWRIVQALGACSGVVLARAMVRDLYPPGRAAQMLSTLITIMAIAPLAGPLVGGQILAIASWRVIFWVMAIMGLVTLAALFTLKESLPAVSRTSGSFSAAFASYGDLIRDRGVLVNAAVGGLFYVGIYAYISGTPFVFITYYGVPAQLYGVLFGASIVGIMAMNLINVRLVPRLGSQRLLRIGASGAGLAGLASAVMAFTGWGGLSGLLVPLLAYCAMSGLIVANSIAGALTSQPKRAGATSALVGALHYGVGIAGSGLVALFSDGTPRPLGATMAVGGLGCLAVARLVTPRSS
jgi:DHA1 family bicyclomycin/chloramphenicol resistance-like MFS transporter